MTIENQKPRIITVKELLRSNRLVIPDYQRPYKWTTKHVNQLIDDILLFQKKPAYRLGTLVCHLDENKELNIVDGQQRTITLTLLAHAIFTERSELLKKVSKETNLREYEPTLTNLKFSNSISIQNIQENYREIKSRIREFDEKTIEFFYYRCELVQVIITEISEAFQFFDSQNARGKDLEPHDLLKAFHLREMQHASTQEERINCVTNWEQQDMNDLSLLFGNYLYRIRQWSKGASARYFTKDDVDVFKGISPQTKEQFPYTHLHRIAHFYVDGYNGNYQRNIDGSNMSYPFQLDQVVINGSRFFEMVRYYQDFINRLTQDSENKLDGFAKDIFRTLQTYDGRNRIGDKYVRTLFDCCIIYYMDKFGTTDLDRAIEKFFVWTYTLRITNTAVQLASIDNYALSGSTFFKAIREALKPSDVLNIPVQPITFRKATKVEPLVELLNRMNYYAA